ncbi:MAG: hypothetical protein JXP34_21550 [Planctomycetes bacterium]|nr:hypothetical protein [Planctomycetota bacterium]
MSWTDRTLKPAAMVAALGLYGLAPAEEPPAPAKHFVRTRALQVPFRAEGPSSAPIAEVHLFETTDGGRTWRLNTRWKGPSPIRFEVPSDGEYGFRVAARIWSDDPPPPASGEAPDSIVVVDTTPPRIEGRWPRQRGFYQGDPIPLAWSTEDANLPDAPVRIAFALGDLDVWTPIRSEEEKGEGKTDARFLASCDRMTWLPPLAKGTVRVRLTAEDLAGNIGQDEWSCEIRELEEWSQSRFISVKPAWPTRRVLIHYRSLGDLMEKGLRWVEVWLRAPSEAWRLVDPKDVDRRSPILIVVPDDGEYEIFLAAIGPERGDGTSLAWDLQGRTLPPPDAAAGGATYPPSTFTPPDARVLVDTTPPNVTILSAGPAGGESAWIRAGEPIEIAYTVEEEHPAPDGIEIEFTIGDGEWRPLPAALETIDRGRVRIALPAIDTEALRFRVVAADAVGWTGVAETEPLTVVNAWGDALARAREGYREGVGLFRSGDAEGALAALAKALRYAREAATAEGAGPEGWERKLAGRWGDLLGLIHDMGAVANALGRRDEAEEWLRKATRIAFEIDARPQKFVFAFHLASSLLSGWNTGDGEDQTAAKRLAEAREWLDRIKLAEIYQAREFRQLEAELGRLRRELADRRMRVGATATRAGGDAWRPNGDS